MNIQINNRFQKLESYRKMAKLAHIDQETQNYLCRFGAVLVCGNIERCIEIIILGRLSTKTHPRVLEFVKSHFKRGMNLDCTAIEQLLLRFDPDWYRKFHVFIESNPDIKEGVSSCYSVRNSVAHGGSNNMGLARFEELIEISRRLINIVVECTE